jgi:hypothetical protein
MKKVRRKLLRLLPRETNKSNKPSPFKERRSQFPLLNPQRMTMMKMKKMMMKTMKMMVQTTKMMMRKMMVQKSKMMKILKKYLLSESNQMSQLARERKLLK